MEEEYNIDINKLREERAKSREVIKDLTFSIERILGSLKLTEGDSLISWEEIKKVKVGERLNISDKVYFVKYLDNKTSMGFYCHLKAGGTFGIQKHDCLEETLVIKGNLIETYKSEKIYKKGQTVTYRECELHQPYCTEDSVYKVLFTKKGNISCI